MRIELDDVARPQVLALLETGSHVAFMPAQALYRSVGFRECGPFGACRENGFSVFMSLRFDDEPQRPDNALEQARDA